jgi:hypothetical protein
MMESFQLYVGRFDQDGDASTQRPPIGLPWLADSREQQRASYLVIMLRLYNYRNDTAVVI